MQIFISMVGLVGRACMGLGGRQKVIFVECKSELIAVLTCLVLSACGSLSCSVARGIFRFSRGFKSSSFFWCEWTALNLLRGCVHSFFYPIYLFYTPYLLALLLYVGGFSKTGSVVLSVSCTAAAVPGGSSTTIVFALLGYYYSV